MRPIERHADKEKKERQRKILGLGMLLGLMTMLLLVGLFFIGKFVLTKYEGECSQAPFSYAVKQLEKEWGHSFYALGKFNSTNSPTIFINSSGAYRV